jgi:hypothetical protein
MPEDKFAGDSPSGPGKKARRRAKQVLGPIAFAVAILYFLIDALFLSIVRPVARVVGRLPVFSFIKEWLKSLGPYPTLALFLVPVVVLEPAKPLGAYLIATGRVAYGVTLVGVAEVLKITVVERLFHFSRDKLMTIAAFACAYNWLMVWLGYLRNQPLWQAVAKQFSTIKAAARRLFKRPRAIR